MNQNAGLLARLRQGLSRTRAALTGRLERALAEAAGSEDEWDALEELLLGADFGVQATQRLLETVRDSHRAGDGDGGGVVAAGTRQPVEGDRRHGRPPVFGVPVGRPCGGSQRSRQDHDHREAGASVGAGTAGRCCWPRGDTFRAGAIEQLEIWGGRAGAEVIKHAPGQDPSGVVFDAAHAAQKRGDVLLIDTAGRLHNKVNLVEELKKMRRVLGRVQEGAPHETLLVVDASTGQNALAQARIFQEAVGVSGIVLTKLDGTAKGGVVLRIQQELAIPVEFVGVGEGVDDLQEFDPEAFVEAFFE